MKCMPWCCAPRLVHAEYPSATRGTRCARCVDESTLTHEGLSKLGYTRSDHTHAKDKQEKRSVEDGVCLNVRQLKLNTLIEIQVIRANSTFKGVAKSGEE
jgi:hypothetical protein